MIIDIYKFKDYKEYLGLKVQNEGKSTRGLRSRLCKFIGCQPSYLSQVLNRKPNLTLEQAERVNRFFYHNKAEAKYFLLMVEYARAGTRDLASFFLEQLREMQDSRFDFKTRLGNTEDIPESVMSVYYSTWYYSAIHVILSIPEFQDSQKIARHFNLPASLVVHVIDFLKESGLIDRKNGFIVHTKKRIHLARDSEFIQHHHINWRSQVLQAVERNFPENLHYSNVIAIAKSDFKKIKEILMSSVEDARKIIGPSKEETICAMAIDFFKV